MGADADDMIECPACHLSVRIAPRCEICGSPLPEVVAAAPAPAPPIWEEADAMELVDPAEPQKEAAEADVQPTTDFSEPIDSPLDEEPVAAVDRIVPPERHDPAEEPEPSREIREPAREPWQRPPARPISPEPPLVAEKPSAKEISRRLFTDFEFKGRMAKRAYWRMFAWRAAAALLGVVLILSDEDIQYGEPGALAVLIVVGIAVIGFSGLAEASRRLHDTGKRGLWNLLILIPYVGFIPWLYLLAQDGQPRDNLYGPIPADYPAAGAAPRG